MFNFQEQSGAKMQMIQDTQEVTGQPKPLRIQGDPDKVRIGTIDWFAKALLHLPQKLYFLHNLRKKNW